MKIGIRNGTLKMDWAGAIETVARLGFDCVELDVHPGYAETMMWQREGQQKLAENARSHGCEICSICLGALWTTSPASDDGSVRNAACQLMQESTEVAAGLGATWILAPITPGGDGVSEADNVSRWIEAVKAVAPAAEDNGVFICLENVGRGCGKSAADLLRLIEGADMPHVGAYYDMGNAILFGNDPVQEIRQLGNLVRIVHIKDHSDLLGQGDVPIRSCLQALNDIGYEGRGVMETMPTDDPVHAATYNLGFVHGLLSE